MAPNQGAEEPKGTQLPLVFDARILVLLETGIQSSLSKWDLGEMVDGDCLMGNNRDESTLEPATIKRYRSHLDQLQRFFMLIGCYDSLLIMQDPRPVDVPSMDVKDIVLYIQYKYGSPNSPLKYPNDEVVKDVLGNIVSCSGAWKTPFLLESFKASIAAIHRGQGQFDSYRTICEACILRDTEHNDRSGCRTHAGRALLLRSGEPNKSKEFACACSAVVKARDLYEENGSSALIPKEVRDIRRALLIYNDLFNLQLYTILLVSISCFLRFDDFSSILIANVITKLHVVNATVISGICLRVKGKSDKHPVYIYLWADDDNPEFCPVRHLLIYLFLTGIKSGLLFPDLSKPRPNGHSTHSLPYKTISRSFKKVISHVVPQYVEDNEEGGEEDERPTTGVMKFGTHTARKTAYVFAVFGGGALHDIMECARHKSEENAKKYRKQAMTLYNIHILQQNTGENNVSKWRSNFLDASTVQARSINSPSTPHTAPIHELARRFVCELMGIHPSHRYIESPVFMSQQVITFKPTFGTADKIKVITNRPWNENAGKEVLALSNILARELVQDERKRQQDAESGVLEAEAEAVANANAAINANVNTGNVAAPVRRIAKVPFNVLANPEPSPKRARTYGEWTFDDGQMNSFKKAELTRVKMECQLALDSSCPLKPPCNASRKQILDVQEHQAASKLFQESFQQQHGSVLRYLQRP
jgi:hypothetical protein